MMRAMLRITAAITCLALIFATGCVRSYTVNWQDLEDSRQKWRKSPSTKYFMPARDGHRSTYIDISKIRKESEPGEDMRVTVSVKDPTRLLQYMSIPLLLLGTAALSGMFELSEQNSDFEVSLDERPLVNLLFLVGVLGLGGGATTGVMSLLMKDAESNYPGPYRKAGFDGFDEPALVGAP